MKMIMAIVHSEDELLLTSELNKNNYFVTKLATTGGFLKKGNTTLMLGVEDEKIDDVCKLIQLHSGRRNQLVYSTPLTSGSSFSHGGNMSMPAEMEAGGATIFVFSVDEFKKV